MELFAVHVITPNGDLLFDKVMGTTTQSLTLLNRGILNSIREDLNKGMYHDAVTFTVNKDNQVWFHYQNIGDFIIIITADQKLEIEDLVSRLTWNLLRIIDNYQLKAFQEGDINLSNFSDTVNTVINNFDINLTDQLDTDKKELTTVSIMELPTKLRPLALRLLADANLEYYKDISEIATELEINENELNEQIHELESRGFIIPNL